MEIGNIEKKYYEGKYDTTNGKVLSKQFSDDVVKVLQEYYGLPKEIALFVHKKLWDEYNNDMYSYFHYLTDYIYFTGELLDVIKKKEWYYDT